MATATVHSARQSTMMLTWVAFALLVVGGLNWGLVGFFNFDLVAAIFGAGTPVSRVVYALVGLAALYCAIAIPKLGQQRLAPDVL